MKSASILTKAFLAAACAAAWAGGAAAATVLEDFSEAANGVGLSTLSGWTLQSGTTDAQVLTSAGYANQGATSSAQALYQLALTAGQTVSAPSAADFSIKLKLSATNNYQQAQILLGKTGGVDGLSVAFNGGTNDTNTDNYIQVSTGGNSWGSITYATVASSAWVAGDWYQVDIGGIQLSATGAASLVSGTLTVTDLTTSAVLVSGVTVTGFGSSGSLGAINDVLVGNKGTARALSFDDVAFSASAVPEPGTWALGLLGAGAGLLLRRRRLPAS